MDVNEELSFCENSNFFVGGGGGRFMGGGGSGWVRGSGWMCTKN